MNNLKGVGCIIGEDYPKPIVDHSIIHKENIQKMKAAYSGNSEVESHEKPKKPEKRKSEPKQNDITKYMKKK